MARLSAAGSLLNAMGVSLAGKAPVPSAVLIDVLGNPRMPVRARFFENPVQSAPLILGRRHCFKMIGIYAGMVSAKMIPVAFGRSAEQKCMGPDLPAIKMENSVPIGIKPTGPQPATISAARIDFGPEPTRGIASIEGNGQRIAMFLPSLIVHSAPAAFIRQLRAVFDGASGSLISHRESTLPGVTGQDVSASLPLHFTRSAVAS